MRRKRPLTCPRAPREQIYNKVKEYAFKYMPSIDLRKWLQTEQTQDPEEQARRNFEFIQSAMLNLLISKTNSRCSSEEKVKALLDMVSSPPRHSPPASYYLSLSPSCPMPLVHVGLWGCDVG